MGRVAAALLLMAWSALAPAIEPMPGAAIHWVDEPVLGGRIAVHEAGVGHARAILLIHGIGEGGARDFRQQIAWLRESYHVVAPDLPGFGASDKANVLYSPANYADALKRVADRFVGRPFALVGHSMDGIVAMRYAAAYPQDVEQLVVMDAPSVLHPVSSASQFIASLGMAFIPPIVDPSHEIANLARRLLGSLARARPDPQIILASPELRQRFLAGDPVRIAGLAAVTEDLRDALPRLRMPTLLVWGADDDIASPRVGRVLERTLPDARLQLLEDVRHTPMSEAPTRLRGLLEPFLASGARPSAVRLGPIGEPRGEGRCYGERGRVFEGEYDRLTIEGCSRAIVRYARVRELRVLDSSVELQDSVVGGGAVGLYARNSTVVATGGRIEGDVAILANASRLDLAALEIVGREAAIRVEPGEAGSPPLPSLAVLSLARVRSPRTSGEQLQVYSITGETPL